MVPSALTAEVATEKRMAQRHISVVAADADEGSNLQVG
jgi:hypothetical protein